MSKQTKKTTYALSRRSRAALTVLGLLLSAAFIWLDHSQLSYKWQSQPKTVEQVKGRDVEKYHQKTCTVVHVVDGDTIDIDVPDGSNNHTRIRLWGIDTPETKNPKVGVMYFGPEASEFTTKLALRKPVTIYLDGESHTRDKYERLLAYVQLPDGRFLNEVLLSEGFTYADSRFRHSFYNKYKQLEAAARSQKRGLWQNVTPDQFPQWRQNSNVKSQNPK